ncbi:MAG: tetratricopeptide repeat protein [Thermodesulfobacteriota bacterium]
MGRLFFTGCVALAWVLAMNPGLTLAESDADESVRDAYRYQVRSVAGWAAEELKTPKGNNMVFFADYDRGIRGSAVGFSAEEAQELARTTCEQSGGACERLYSVSVKNATDVGLDIYLYYPHEPRAGKNHSLFTWIARPEDKIRLSLKHGDRVFVTKNFLIHVVSRDGFIQWGPKKIDAFRFQEEHGYEGDSLTIRISEGRLIGQKHLSWSHGLSVNESDDQRKLFEILLRNAVKGLASAQFHVAGMYEEGKGCRKDLGQALRWYHRASQQGHVEAQQALRALRNKLTCDWMRDELMAMKKSAPRLVLEQEPLVELLGDPRHRCIADGKWTWEWPCVDASGSKKCIGYVPEQRDITADGPSSQEEPNLDCKCAPRP